MDVNQHINNILDQLITSKVPQNEFNSIEYINKIFPNEQSLSNIEEVLKVLKNKISELDNDIRTVICSQKSVEENGRQTLEDARSQIVLLTNVIKEIKGQAKQSEKIVNEITSNIKQLDNAKRNLTSSIIMLNNLHILVQGTFILKEAAKKRQYGVAEKTLQGLLDVIKQFERFKHIPHIHKLTDEIENDCKELGQQILGEFHDLFDVRNANASLNPNQIQSLAEACLVLSILEPKYKRELLTWFVDCELSEYKTLFQDNQDIAWLDKIEKRFAWIKKHLVVFEKKISFIFPPKWELSECIAVEFCKITHGQLLKVMKNRSAELDVSLLLPAITKTTAFEKLLSQRFSGVTLNEQLLPKKSVNPFAGLITSCFENHLNIYVEAQDKNFEKLIENLVDENNKTNFQEILKSEIFTTSGKLFTQYKNCLIQCISLSNKVCLVSLSNTFQKYLREYAHKILQSNIPRVGSNIPLGAISIITNTATGGVLQVASSAAGLLQVFLKELGNKSYTIAEILQVCSIILTANYCLETTQQLEKKIQEKIDPSLVDKISMSSECDLFHGVILNCVQLLVLSVENNCEQPLSAMVKTPWSNVGTPIGPSQYVSTLISIFHELFPVIRENLSELPNQYYNFCHKFVSSFIIKYIANIFRCKPLSHGGAEQLLLDSHTLKKILLELPEYKSNIRGNVPQNYGNTVVAGMTKAEMILKIVLVSYDPPNMFVENYFKLFHDHDMGEFQKILDMKSIKRSEMVQFLELFKKKASSVKNDTRVFQTDHETAEANRDEVIGLDSSRIKKLEKLIKNRL